MPTQKILLVKPKICFLFSYFANKIFCTLSHFRLKNMIIWGVFFEQDKIYFLLTDPILKSSVGKGQTKYNLISALMRKEFPIFSDYVFIYVRKMLILYSALVQPL